MRSSQSPRNLPLTHTQLTQFDDLLSGLQIVHDLVGCQCETELKPEWCVYMIMCDKEMESGLLNVSAETVYGEKSAFTQTEHNIVAAYLITAGKDQSVFVCMCV